MIQQIQKAIKSRLCMSPDIQFGGNTVFTFQVGCKGGFVSLSTFSKQKTVGMDTLTEALFYTAIPRRGP